MFMRLLRIALLISIHFNSQASWLHRLKPLLAKHKRNAKVFLIKHKKPAKAAVVLGAAIVADRALQKEHIKFAALNALLKEPAFMHVVQTYPRVKTKVTQSLGYQSFTQFLNERDGVRRLKQNCAQSLEAAGVPLDLCPTEGYLLAIEPKTDVTQWFGQKFIDTWATPTSKYWKDNSYNRNYHILEQHLGIAWYNYHGSGIKASERKRIKEKADKVMHDLQTHLHETMDNALILEKEKWHAPHRMYSLYHALSTTAYLHKFLNTCDQRSRIPLLLTDSNKPDLFFSDDGKKEAFYTPTQASERFLTHVRPYGTKVSTDWLWRNSLDERAYNHVLLSVNLTPMMNAQAYGESCFVPLVENKGYFKISFWDEHHALFPKYRKLISNVGHVTPNGAFPGVLLQVFLDKETADKATFPCWWWGAPLTETDIKTKKEVRSQEKVTDLMQELADKPMSTYKKLEKVRYAQARIIAMKDVLLDEEWASKPEHFQVMAHMREDTRAKFNKVAEEVKKAAEQQKQS